MYKDSNLLIKPVIQPLEKYAEEIAEVAQIYLHTKLSITALFLVLKNG